MVENVLERQAFDTAYSPVLDNLIEARQVYRRISGAPDSGGGISAATGPSASRLTLWRIRPYAPLSDIFKFFNLTADFLLQSDTGLSEGVASLYADDPILATYLLGCRADWLKQWADTHEGSVPDDTAPPSPASMGVTLGHVAALVENICVHLVSTGLAKRTKSLVVVEILTGKRNPEYMRRFEVVLATDGLIRWELEYKSVGFPIDNLIGFGGRWQSEAP